MKGRKFQGIASGDGQSRILVHDSVDYRWEVATLQVAEIFLNTSSMELHELIVQT